MKLIIFKNILFVILALAFSSCIKDKGINEKLPILKTKKKSTIAYAEGFTITENGNYTILEIKRPWPESDQTFTYVLISKEEAAKTTFIVDQYNGIILTPIQKAVVTSTTHIPALELLNVENTLIGFPGTDYISSEKTRARIDNKLVRELGKNEDINTEVLLDINPNIVVAFGIDGKSKSLETIKNANIPVIYNGDWVEKSPLAKAEWIKFFGALYNKEKKADSIFSQIEKNYLEAKKIATKVVEQPTVLSGAMHKDIWYLPKGTSTEAQLLKDANVNYLWSDTSGSGSLALNFETVYEKAKTAHLWLSPSHYKSFEALEKANQHYTKFDAFKNKNIYTFSNITGETGGVLYYELGTARPDLVLKDIIKICHPELLTSYTPYFFKPLE